jgi:8-oxo-dGTP pyrophosphatase MutT (NUDIX family)
VAGGIPSGMGIFESLVKESMEEAGIEEDIIQKHTKAVGVVSYFFRSVRNIHSLFVYSFYQYVIFSSSSPQGWLQPEVEYVTTSLVV